MKHSSQFRNEFLSAMVAKREEEKSGAVRERLVDPELAFLTNIDGFNSTIARNIEKRKSSFQGDGQIKFSSLSAVKL